MKIRVIWVGKTKEVYVREGITKYIRLISPFCDIQSIEIRDAKDTDIEKALVKEGKKIVRTSSLFVLLHEKGKELSSEQFADFLLRNSSCDFVIGGPYGVSEEVFSKASHIFSLSKMTFTHEMSRIILLEQIYRALTIIKKRGYHH